MSEMSSGSRRPGVAISIVALCAAGLWAQEAPQRRFDPWGEATVAAAFEHDLAKAAKIYRDIAGSPQETAEMQTKALLELGKVLRKAGMIAEAKAALKQASEGRGRAAKEATEMLSAGTQDPDLLQVKVEKLLKQLRAGTGGADNDLLWIGEPAAPYVADAVNKEKADLEFIASASEVLLQMGGAAAEEWAKKALKYPDVLKRRAVLKGLGINPRNLKISHVTVQGFLEDKEPTVRRDAVGYLGLHVPANRIIAMLKDPAPEVVQAARQKVQALWNLMKHGDRKDENTAELIRIFDDSGWELGLTPSFTDAPKGRIFFLRSLRRDVLRNRGAVIGDLHASTAPTAEEWKELATTAAALGPATGDTRKRKPSGWMARKSLAYFVRPRLKAWDHEAMPLVLKLASLSYDPAFNVRFDYWLVTHGKVEDIPEIAKVLRWLERPHDVLKWMAERSVPAAALGNLKSFVEWLDGLDRKNDRDIPFPRSLERTIRYATCRAIAAIRTPDAEKYLVSLIRRVPDAKNAEQKDNWEVWKDEAFETLRSSGDDQTMRALAELLVSPGDSKHARHVRYAAFEKLANLQAEVAVDRYAKAYQLGFGEPAPKHKRTLVTFHGQVLPVFGGLRTIVESRGAAPEVRKGRQPYSDETVAKIFDSCLATGELAAFEDATYCVTQMRLPEAVVEAIATRALECPDKKPTAYHRDHMTLRQLLVRYLVDRYPSAPGIVELIRGSLQDRDPEIRRLVLKEIESRHVKDKVVLGLLEKLLMDEREAIVDLASSRLRYDHPESLIAEKDYLLGYKNSSVQSDVAMALLDTRGAEAIPTVGKLLLAGTHLHHGHRKTLVLKMAEFRDMRAVPFLLEALKDESGDVRKAAEEELKSIRFYNEQKRLWKRLMNGTDLSAASAAEALVRQAREASRKDVRLTAIESLGTLGKPETLPFLVKLMADVDPDIRKAAKAAADRINAAKVEGGEPKK